LTPAKDGGSAILIPPNNGGFCYATILIIDCQFPIHRFEKIAARQKTKFLCVAKSFDGSTYFDIIAPQLENVQSKPLLQPVNAIR